MAKRFHTIRAGVVRPAPELRERLAEALRFAGHDEFARLRRFRTLHVLDGRVLLLPGIKPERSLDVVDNHDSSPSSVWRVRAP